MKISSKVRYTRVGELLEFYFNYIWLRALFIFDRIDKDFVFKFYPDEESVEEFLPDHYLSLLGPWVDYKELRSGLLLKIYQKNDYTVIKRWHRQATFLSPTSRWVSTIGFHS